MECDRYLVLERKGLHLIKLRTIFLLVHFALVWGCFGCASLAPSAAQTVQITIIGTNDFHGSLEARPFSSLDKRLVGGMDVISAYFSAVRASNPGGVILLDAGDIYQGTLLSAASEGEAAIRFFNQLKVDAAAIGNHDFDFGPIGLHTVVESAGEDSLGVLKKCMRQAHFPFLAANIIEKSSGCPPRWPNFSAFTIVSRRGIKVGVIGLSSVDTPVTTRPSNVRGLAFLPLFESLNSALVKVRARGAQVVVLLVHDGVELDPKSGKTQGPVALLARALPPGALDLIVAGHIHKPFSGWINGIPIIQSRPFGKAFGRVDLTVTKKTGRVVHALIDDDIVYYRKNEDGSRVRYANTEIKPDKAMQRELTLIKKSIKRLQGIEIGHATFDLSHRNRYNSAVGNLVCDAMRAADKEIDIAMFNSGGLRKTIPKGVISFGLVYEVLPFDNKLVKVKLKGSQIKEIIEHGLASRYGVMEISGVRVWIDPHAPKGKRCLSIKTQGGQEIVKEKEYVVGTNEFLFSGGDGYTTFSHGNPMAWDHRLIRDMVVQYIKKMGRIKNMDHPRYLPVSIQP
jgi:5'-nucleotidase